MGDMVKCLDCKKTISDSSSKCPHCGSENHTKYNLWVNGIGGIVILYILVKWYFDLDINLLFGFY